MRKHLIWVLVLAATLATAVMLSSVGGASAVPNIQTITGSFTPKKLPAHKKAPISLFTDVAATNPGNPNQLPNATTLSKVDYDQDGAFYQKGFPTCDSTQFTAATTTQQAKDLCSDALEGGGTSIIQIPSTTGGPPITINATVTAFNGAHKTVVLFSYNTLSGAQTLIGQIGPADPGSPPTGAGPGYGITLTVPVPKLAGGSAVITEFNTRVHKTYHYKGKLRSIESSRCGPDKKLRIQARFTDDQGQVAVGSSFQKCKQKSSHHHH
jgi:hypothetical protein